MDDSARLADTVPVTDACILEHPMIRAVDEIPARALPNDAPEARKSRIPATQTRHATFRPRHMMAAPDSRRQMFLPGLEIGILRVIQLVAGHGMTLILEPDLPECDIAG